MKPSFRNARGMVALVAAVSCCLVALGLMTAPVASAYIDTVVPPMQDLTDGNASSHLPFDCASVGARSVRYQQVYAASAVPAGVIASLAFRTNEADGTAFGPTTVPNVTVRLATTQIAPGALSSVLSDNTASNITTVFSGDLELSSNGWWPRSFDVTVPFQTPFNFDGVSGNLLLDVTIPTCVSTSAFDAQGSSSSTSTAVDVDGSHSTSDVGLVTQFRYGCAPDHTLTGSQPARTLNGGTWCLDHARVNGPLSFGANTSVLITATDVAGALKAQDPGGIRICGSGVRGGVTVTGSSDSVIIGERRGACAGNNIGGSLTVSRNPAGHLEIARNNVSSSLTFDGNTSTQYANPMIAGNTIGGDLSCKGNFMPPVAGPPNTIRGSSSGQCAGMSIVAS